MVERPRFIMRFADGGPLELGPRTLLMGVLNMTPDSFSDGGGHATVDAAIAAAGRMVQDGADLIDIGGESTRPGAEPVDPAVECERVLPVVSAVRRRFDTRVSIDTRRAEVARRAIDAGADMVNDVSALEDPAMGAVVAKARVPLVLMHMRGNPSTMQRDTRYDDLLGDVVAHLQARIDHAVGQGVCSDKIIVDPGIGFGKSAEGNLLLLQELRRLSVLGRPVLVGASRKSFIGRLLDLPVSERLEGSLAAAVVAAWNGAHIIRAHDVLATSRALGMVDAIRTGGR